MGFGVSAATGIILVGVVINLGTLSASYFSLQHTVQDATRHADARAAALRQASITIDNHSYDGGSQTVRVNVTNTGAVTFNAAYADLVLDGGIATLNITGLFVNSANSSVWPPATRLEIFATALQDPVAIVVIAPNGASAYWRI